MNNKHVEGKWNEVKGSLKQDMGHATGNTRLEGEGIVDRIKGKFQQSLGDLKDAVKRGVDNVLEDKKK